MAWVGLLLATAVEAAAAAVDSAACATCGSAGDEEAVLLQRQGVHVHGSGEEAPSHEMARPPDFVLALMAKDSAAAGWRSLV